MTIGILQISGQKIRRFFKRKVSRHRNCEHATSLTDELGDISIEKVGILPHEKCYKFLDRVSGDSPAGIPENLQREI